ncbi:PREDICTED: WD repeat-containing protein 90 isoform X3 [Myotis brandtii]|uniref:WD repeat-containing protein 90 isoform X3 n=1 Tax=Myotis brandtii TaxID=109478 RepID=UPI00070417C0|nr:PREDICTED: WD repeat-containing protein 90 isoform X3 [Myotis brandtii]
MARVWQHPFLNVFRQFKVDEWKRSTKEGDVATVMDKTLKCTVYRIRGTVSASNYIQLPKTSAQSLGLTGRYLYLLFRPLSTKHFVIHLDLSTEDRQVIRVSLSNLFKEFKSTATWLQFPFICEGTSRKDLAGAAPPGARWTCLQLDLHDILLVYLNRRYSHLKSVRLCASLLVRNLYTSDLCFDPAVTVAEARRAKLPVTPMPREMAFPVPKGENWHDHYIHIRFPSNSPAAPSKLVQRNCSPPEAGFPRHVPQLLPRPGPFSKSRLDSVSPVVQTLGPTAVSACALRDGAKEGSPRVWRTLSPPQSRQASLRLLPEDGLSSECSEVSIVGGSGVDRREPPASAKATDKRAAGSGPPVSACKLAVVPPAPEDATKHESFLPDPVLRLKRVIGLGGHSTKWALWTKDGAAVVYPCHAIIVVLCIDTREQCFFLGHTDKVSALALDGSNSLLASAQAHPHSMLRLWDFQTRSCLSLFRSPVHTVCSLSFSDSGALLCCIGKDRHGKMMVVAWGTDQVGRGGEAVILAKANTDVDIQAFEIAFCNETRMASCGRGNVRLWRLRGGGLCSCPVDLGEHHAVEFTDLAFGKAQDGHTLYVCSRSGHILEIDHQRMAVRRARYLLPTQTPGSPLPQKQAFSLGPGIAISSLSVSQAECAVGSEDGYLRLWPLDFSSVLLEAEHEGPISSVRISPDGLRVLSTTSSGHLGFLDVPSREYNVLVRSHTALVLALATECSRGQLATVSQDHTVRVWDLATLQQLYDFTSPEEAPCAVAFHPTQPVFFCGFSSGAVRSFSLEATRVLVEHRCHQGAITGLVTSPDGSLLFSACSQGTLAQYHCTATCCRVLRVTANVVCRDALPSPNALAVSGDNRLLAFMGPFKYMVTIMDAASLDDLLRVDVSALDPASSGLDSAVAVCFSPAPRSHLLVSLSSNKVVVLDAISGRLVREFCDVHPVACSALALSGDARLLLTAADRAIKVWDYLTQSDPSCQVYIGHSEPVQAVAFTPDQQHLLSVGDAIFLWDILASPERSPPESVPGSPGPPPTCEAVSGRTAVEGPNASQQEDALSGTNGLPRWQVPVPSQAAPPQLSICAGPLDGGDGTSSVSDEGPSEESHSPEGLCQAPGRPVLVQKEACGAGDGAAGGPWDPSVLPHPHGQPSAWSLRRARTQPTARPDAYKHFTARYKASLMAKNVSSPPAGGEWLHLKAVVGYNGNGRANVIWRPDTGFFAYTCGCLVVVEDLHSGSQQHWLGHSEEISTLALSHDAQVLASASGSSGAASGCQIRIWDVPGGSCQQLLSHHCTAVQALAFSLDDRLLVTLGDYGDRTLALWSMATYELVSSTHLPEPVHDMAFNPWGAGELACVGQGALTLWLLQQRGADISLQVHREPIPETVGAGELTSLCYGAEPLLYCGSNAGQVCVWDTSASRCFLAWEADDGEIGVLLCSGSRLVSGSNTRRLRLWAVGAVAELRRKGSGARSSSVFMERELTLDGAVVSAVFHESMDMGVVGTTAGTLWYVSWAEGTSTRLISGHRSKVLCGALGREVRTVSLLHVEVTMARRAWEGDTWSHRNDLAPLCPVSEGHGASGLAGYLQVNEVVFSPSESHCATCGDDGSVRVWSLSSMELVIQFQVLNQSCLCLAWSPPSCGRPEQQHMAAGYSDGTLRVFNVSRISMELKMHPHLAALTAIAFSADGQTIISGDKDGLVAVSQPRTGLTFRTLSDHRGAPISTIQSTSKENGAFGVEGTDLWLAASGDQRVSIWASDWLRDCCELVDWLSFPAPILTEASDCSPPSLAAFCPWDRTLLVCAGLGPHPEAVFYSLCLKQVVKKIPLPFFAVSLSLSPRAHFMAIGFAERVLRLVDCVSGAAQDFAGHDDAVQLCRFAPSASLLFTAAHNEILVWEVTHC